MYDVSGFILNSDTKAFMNNDSYTGSFTIGGTLTPGYNEITVVVPVDASIDMPSALFNGPADWYGSDPRPSNGWFQQGYVYVRGDNAGAGYVDYPVPFRIWSRVEGSNVIIKAVSVSQIAVNLTLTNTNVSYRLIDYSVF